MAVADKLVNLADLKVAYDDNAGKISDLKSALTDKSDAASITEGISGNPAGLTIQEVNGDLRIYGTVSQVRRICFLNGQSGSKTTGSEFDQTLPAGTYEIQADCTGAQSEFRIDGTYTTFNDAFVICSSSAKNVTITFTAPVMIGFYTTSGRSYGTSESPSLFSISIKSLTAKDIIARESVRELKTSLETSIQQYNSVHAPGYQNAYAGIIKGVPTFTFNADKSITVMLPASSHGRVFWTGGYKTDSAGSEERAFTVPKKQWFVYDTEARDFAVRALGDRLSTDIVCFWVTSSGAMVGPWLAYLAIQEANAISDDTAEYTLDAIPEYYNANNYLEEKINSIKTIGSTLSAQSVRFVFVTDYHIGKNNGKSPALAKRIMRETGIKELFFNGDFNDKADTPLAGYKVICDFLNKVKPLEFGNNIHYTTGNHEYNNPSTREPELQIDRSPLFQLFNAFDRNIVSVDPETSNAYYVDYPAAKIRVYGIDCDFENSVTVETRKAIFDSLLTVPEGYAVLVTSHVGKSGAGAATITARFETVMACCAAMNEGTQYNAVFGSPYGTIPYNFAGKARTFIGALTGHTHVDDYVIYNNKFPVVITECDAHDTARNPGKVDGTITEQAFEVVQVDVPAQRIYLTRIGNGSDRTFSFGENGAGLIT